MFDLIQTAIAIATAMLAGSLFVTAAVQFVRRLAGLDADALKLFLRNAYVGFRSFHEPGRAHEGDNLESWQKEAESFVTGVLASPQINENTSSASFMDDPRPEYVGADDLVAIVYLQAVSDPEQRAREKDVPGVKKYTIPWVKKQPRTLKLDPTWFPTSKDPQFAKYATVQNFAIYVERWFRTLDKSVTQDFKIRMKRVSLAFSAVVIILLNLDSFQLVKAFYESASGRDAIVAEAENLRRTAGRLGIPDAPLPPGEKLDGTSKELATEMQKLGLILTTGPVHVGWRDSPIVRAVCAYRGKCGGPEVLRPSGWALAWEIGCWIAGLLFSLAMLGLGAPFWYSTLQRALRWSNEAKLPNGDRASSDDGKGTPQTGSEPETPDSGADDTAQETG